MRAAPPALHEGNKTRDEPAARGSERHNHQTNDYLHMWSPARRDDSHWNRLAFHPCCANAFDLELIRIATRSEGKGAAGPADFVATADH